MLKIAWSDEYVLDLPANHRFPMEKYALIRQQLMYEGTVKEDNFFEPEALEEKYILNTHDKNYWEKLQKLDLTPKEIRVTGFPLSENLVKRELIIGNGTVQASLFALEYGIAMNVSGGTHHAFSNKGEGFCLLNDIGMASNYLLEHHLAKQIMVVDLDVHQGNGTAEIFQNQPKVFTFSVHGERNYPLKKEKSDLDIGLEDFTKDDVYLKILHDTLPPLMDKVEPDFIFYLAGVDILETDKMGRLGVTREGCRLRDQFVLNQCKSNKIPVVVTMGGGYSPQIKDIVEAHANTFRLAQEIYF